MTMEKAKPQAGKLESGGLCEDALGSGGSVVEELKKLLQSLHRQDPRTIESAYSLLNAELAGWRGVALPAASSDSALTKSEALRSQFINKFQIKIIGETLVEFTIPKGLSRIEFLSEAQYCVSGLPIIHPGSDKMWLRDSAFTEKVNENLIRLIDGNVKGSSHMNRAEQEAMGWNNVELSDLACAHAAFRVATGRDLFADGTVRARRFALYVEEIGLALMDINTDRFRNDCFTASYEWEERRSRASNYPLATGQFRRPVPVRDPDDFETW